MESLSKLLSLKRVPLLIFLVLVLLPALEIGVIRALELDLNRHPALLIPLIPAILVAFLVLPLVSSALKVVGVDLGPMGLFGGGLTTAGSIALVILYVLFAFAVAKIANRLYRH